MLIDDLLIAVVVGVSGYVILMLVATVRPRLRARKRR
jgi:hypothetical protein